MKLNQSTAAAQVMVSNPVCAQSWQTLADVHRTMLMHDYSTLPLEDGSRANGYEWKVLHAKDLGEYLLKDRDKRLAERLEQATKLARCVPVVAPETPAERIVTALPVIVAEDRRLLGIVTAFDLL